MFSRRTPDADSENAVIRDIVNERPTREESLAVTQPKMAEKQN